MNKEMVNHLQVIADVLLENNATHLIEEIAKRDYQVAQILDVLVIEDQTINL